MRELRAKGWDAIVPPHKIEKHRGNIFTPEEVNLPRKADYSTSSTEWFVGDVQADLWVVQRGQARGLVGARDGKRIICETDDNSLHIPKWHRSMQPQFRQATLAVTKQMHDGFRCADALTVSTPQLAEDYAEIHDNIFVLRNYLDWEMWETVEQQSEVERQRVRVGWMGAYDFRVGDLDQLRGVIGPWVERHPEVEFVVAGNNAELTHDRLGIPTDQRVSIDGVSFASGRLAEITALMDIGLVPLEPGRFNEGKSHLKGMEYAACGIPCIATPTESYRYWIEEGVNGLFARKPHEWRESLETLVGDDALRRQQGRNARAKAAEHTIQRNSWRWERVYRQVCGVEDDPGLQPPVLRDAVANMGGDVLARH